MAIKNAELSKLYHGMLGAYLAEPGATVPYAFSETPDGTVEMRVRGHGVYRRSLGSVRVEFTPDKGVYEGVLADEAPIMWPVPSASPGAPLAIVHLRFDRIRDACLTHFTRKEGVHLDATELQSAVRQAVAVVSKVKKQSVAITRMHFKTANRHWWGRFVDRAVMSAYTRIHGVRAPLPHDRLGWSGYAAFSCRRDLQEIMSKAASEGVLAPFMRSSLPHVSDPAKVRDCLKASPVFAGMHPSVKNLVVESVVFEDLPPSPIYLLSDRFDRVLDRFAMLPARTPAEQTAAFIYAQATLCPPGWRPQDLTEILKDGSCDGGFRQHQDARSFDPEDVNLEAYSAFMKGLAAAEAERVSNGKVTSLLVKLSATASGRRSLFRLARPFIDAHPRGAGIDVSAIADTKLAAAVERAVLSGPRRRAAAGKSTRSI